MIVQWPSNWWLTWTHSCWQTLLDTNAASMVGLFSANSNHWLGSYWCNVASDLVAKSWLSNCVIEKVYTVNIVFASNLRFLVLLTLRATSLLYLILKFQWNVRFIAFIACTVTVLGLYMHCADCRDITQSHIICIMRRTHAHWRDKNN